MPPSLPNSPLPALYAMVNIEARRLRWIPQQVAAFARQSLGLVDVSQFQPKDWINLCYQMRKL